MGLFQKKEYNTNAPLYSIGASKSLLVIGLGNPGDDYAGTRHNIGFQILDNFAASQDFPGWLNKKDLKCQLSTNDIAGVRVILCKPQTFMNLSGEAAQAVQRFYRITNSDTLAVYDELAIPFGQLRTRVGGSDAGHNGVKSLIQHLGEDFSRLRIGIGQEDIKNTANFVLKKFSAVEKKEVPLVIKEACAIIGEFSTGTGLTHDTRKVL